MNTISTKLSLLYFLNIKSLKLDIKRNAVKRERTFGVKELHTGTVEKATFKAIRVTPRRYQNQHHNHINILQITQNHYI